MKKLGKLKLKEYHKMSDVEMNGLVGGYPGSGTYEDPYRLPEVSVYGTKPCVGCQRWEAYTSNPVNPGGPFTPIGNYIVNQFLPHTCGKW